MRERERGGGGTGKDRIVELWVSNNVMRLFSILYPGGSHTVHSFVCVYCLSYMYYFLEQFTFDIFCQLTLKMSVLLQSAVSLCRAEKALYKSYLLLLLLLLLFVKEGVSSQRKRSKRHEFDKAIQRKKWCV